MEAIGALRENEVETTISANKTDDSNALPQRAAAAAELSTCKHYQLFLDLKRARNGGRA